MAHSDLRQFYGGLIDKDDAAEMRAWAHDGGFSVDGSVRIGGADRAGLERLMRTCARPPFAQERLASQHQHSIGSGKSSAL